MCFLLLWLPHSFATSETEILFQSIPWLSDETQTFRVLADNGFVISDSKGLDLKSNECFYLALDENENVVPSIASDTNYCASASLLGNAKGKIAGFPIKNINLTFAYNGGFQLIYAKVDLVGSDYISIKEKLSKVYGECEENETIEGHTYIWRGTSNSCIALFEYSEGQEYDLCYGRLDAEEILKNCAYIDPEDTSGL